jgi:hypothetical protein
VRQEIADEPAAALGDDSPPGASILREGVALERIDDVADEDGDSLNQYIVYLLSSASGSRMPEPSRPPQRAASSAK